MAGPRKATPAPSSSPRISGRSSRVNRIADVPVRISDTYQLSASGHPQFSTEAPLSDVGANHNDLVVCNDRATNVDRCLGNESNDRAVARRIKTGDAQPAPDERPLPPQLARHMSDVAAMAFEQRREQLRSRTFRHGRTS